MSSQVAMWMKSVRSPAWESEFPPQLCVQTYSGGPFILLSMYFVTCICSKLFGATWVSEPLLPPSKSCLICPFCSPDWPNILETFPHTCHTSFSQQFGIHLTLSATSSPPPPHMMKTACSSKTMEPKHHNM